MTMIMQIVSIFFQVTVVKAMGEELAIATKNITK